MNWAQFLEENPQITTAEIMQRMEAPALDLISTDDLEPEIDLLYQRGRDKGFSTGWPSLDVFYRIAPGYWTLVTGWPNMGKSSWVDNLAINTMVKHSWRWLFFSAENRPYEVHWSSLAELYIGKPFDKDHPDRMGVELRDNAKRFLRDHCWHVGIDDERPLTVKRLLDVCKAAVQRYAINCFVIDPWNELEHSKPNGMTEAEYMSAVLSQVRAVARSTGIHIFVVAHPKSLDTKAKENGTIQPPTPRDVAGGAHWWNKADYAVCVHRDFADQTGETHVYIQKARHRWVARLGRMSLFHQSRTNRYVDPFEQKASEPFRRRREPGDDDE